jgi:hypothetical protein
MGLFGAIPIRRLRLFGVLAALACAVCVTPPAADATTGTSAASAHAYDAAARAVIGAHQSSSPLPSVWLSTCSATSTTTRSNRATYDYDEVAHNAQGIEQWVFRLSVGELARSPTEAAPRSGHARFVRFLAAEEGLGLSARTAENEALRNTLGRLYKPNQTYAGGTAGALREEARTGLEVFGRNHGASAEQNVTALTKIVAGERGPLSTLDRYAALRNLRDLEGAIRFFDSKRPGGSIR